MNNRSESGSLAGTTALITGGSSGIGLAVAREFVTRGSEVVIVGRREEALAVAKKELGQAATTIVADVSDAEEITKAVDMAWDRLGKIDYLAHAAGIVEPATIENIDAGLWRKHIDVNLSGAFYVMKACALRMRERGSGSIVAVGSELSLLGLGSYAHYCASKAGLTGLVKAFAIELAPHVRVNCVCPGPVDTPMMEAEIQLFGGTQEVRDAAVARVPLHRLATPQEIARYIVFLAADATFATGSIVSVDGGVTAQ